MSFTLTLLEKLDGGVATVEDENSFSGSALVQVEEAVADSETDYEIIVALDVSAIKVIIITSDQAVTFETNDGTTPDETINLLAGVPYVWTNTCYFANLLATDWTSVFITNASGSSATVKILALVDSTP